MSSDVLQYRGIVAVCFSCGAEKQQVFSRCADCAAQPRADDELLDSLVLSRYASSETLLARAVAERSPGVVIKAADRTTMRTVSNTLRDQQLRSLLGLAPIKKSPEKSVLNRAEKYLDRLVQAAQAEMPSSSASLHTCLQSTEQLSVWAKNEQLLQALHGEAESASVGLLLETLLEIAERCKPITDQDLHTQLVATGVQGDELGSAERRDVWIVYERSVVDRIVVALERVKSDDLIELFVRLANSTERRRDKQPLPVHKALFDVYKLNAIETLKLEGDNAGRLISAIRTNAASEHALSNAMVAALEALVDNWRKVARPMGGVIADRDVASIRRELQSELQDAADHLVTSGEASLSARASRLALELL